MYKQIKDQVLIELQFFISHLFADEYVSYRILLQMP